MTFRLLRCTLVGMPAHVSLWFGVTEEGVFVYASMLLSKLMNTICGGRQLWEAVTAIQTTVPKEMRLSNHTVGPLLLASRCGCLAEMSINSFQLPFNLQEKKTVQH